MDLGELDDLFDEELEEILEFVEYERRPYTVKERMNPFEELDDVEVTTRFRLSKPSVHMILQQIEGQLEIITDPMYYFQLFTLQKSLHFSKANIYFSETIPLVQ
ncbi:hypothetical protein JTB14_033213 [Gonioctena quinquepunctata]|nr:hypothetical protein JTB14_033213 [Gonioctena quinquepunctata]